MTETAPCTDDLKGAWVTCEHDVRITTGPDQSNMKPTGKHPECFREFLAELMGLGEDSDER